MNWLPRFLVKYFSKDADSTDRFAQRWILWKLVEYEDADAVEGFDPETDTVLSSYPLWQADWDNLEHEEETVSGASVHSICTENEVTSPSIKLCSFIADKRTRISNGTADPNFLKWSFSIDNYPYNSSSSRLALKVSYDSKSAVRDFTPALVDGSVELEDEEALDLGADSGSMSVVSWKKKFSISGGGCTSSVGNIKRSVIREGQFKNDNDTLSNGDNDSLEFSRSWRVSYFSFTSDCQPTTIEWDPDLGVVDDVASSAFVLHPSILLIVLSIIMAAINLL